LGGSAGHDTRLAKILGPAFAQEDIPDVIEKVVDIYLDQRKDEEVFLETFERLGMQHFKEIVYAKVD
jgi:sulfite reductase (NADPH) hemoprotein beta-component